MTTTPKKEPIKRVFDAIEDSIVNDSEADLRADVEEAGASFSMIAQDVRETFARVQKEQRQVARAGCRANVAGQSAGQKADNRFATGGFMMNVKGHLEIGTNGRGDVFVNHPHIEQDETGGHFMFSPEESAKCGRLLIENAGKAVLERIARGLPAADDDAPAEWLLSPSETLYSFASWLTVRSQSLTIGAEHDAAPVAEVVAEFCKASHLADPREEYGKLLALTPAVPT